MGRHEVHTELALVTVATEILKSHELVQPEDAIDRLANLLGKTGRGDEPNAASIRKLIGRSEYAEDILAVLEGLYDTPFVALDALPLDESGEIALERTRIEKLRASPGSLTAERVAKFARYFCLGDDAEIDEIAAPNIEGDIFENEEDHDDSDDDFDYSDFEGSAPLDPDVPLNPEVIQMALVAVREFFPSSRMDLALEAVIDAARDIDSRDLNEVLRTLQSQPDVYEQIYAELRAQTGPLEEEPEELDHSAAEEAPIESSERETQTEESADEELDEPGPPLWSASDLLARVARLQDGQSLDWIPASTPYHYRPPVKALSFEGENPLLLMGITPELVEALSLTPQDVAMYLSRNYKLLSAAVTEHQPEDATNIRQKLAETMVLARGAEAEPDLNLIARHMMTLANPPSPQDIVDHLQRLAHISSAQTRSTEASHFSFLQSSQNLSSDEAALGRAQRGLQLIDENQVLNETAVEGSLWEPLLEKIQDDIEDAQISANSAAILERARQTLERLVEPQRLKLSISAQGQLSYNGKRSRGEYIIGSIDPQEFGFDSFRQLLAANGFTEKTAAGLLPGPGVASDKYGLPVPRYHLEKISLDEFVPLLRFVRPEVRPGALLFSAKRHGDTCTIRLVGRLYGTPAESAFLGADSITTAETPPIAPKFAASSATQSSPTKNPIQLAGLNLVSMYHFDLSEDSVKHFVYNGFGTALAHFRAVDGESPDQTQRYSAVSRIKSEFMHPEHGDAHWQNAFSSLMPESFRDRVASLTRKLQDLASAQLNAEAAYLQSAVPLLIEEDLVPIRSLSGQRLRVYDTATALDYGLSSRHSRDPSLRWEAAMAADIEEGLIDQRGPRRLLKEALTQRREYRVTVGPNGELLAPKDIQLLPNERIFAALRVDDIIDPEHFETVLQSAGLFDADTGEGIKIRNSKDFARNISMGRFRTNNLSPEDILPLCSLLEPYAGKGSYLITCYDTDEGPRFRLFGELLSIQAPRKKS